MNKFESMSFRKDFLLPIEEQDRMLGFIKWGKKNDYPYFLVDLYKAIFSRIKILMIKRVCKLVVGD